MFHRERERDTYIYIYIYVCMYIIYIYRHIGTYIEFTYVCVLFCAAIIVVDSLPGPSLGTQDAGCKAPELPIFQDSSYGPLVPVPSLDPNAYQLCTMYQTEAHGRDPTRVEGAHDKGPLLKHS